MSIEQLIHDFFADTGWETPHVLAAMDKAEDFYPQLIEQVNFHIWCQGRVKLPGDAGYCPSPLAGMGTSIAIVGAYILAGEIATYVKGYEAVVQGCKKLM
ncbi:MAG: hypothetical protein M1812_000203 [Candelaria pacifica]|nr:MAG: hypothetical protein M1812_000203 [Candelaria pacifica]